MKRTHRGVLLQGPPWRHPLLQGQDGRHGVHGWVSSLYRLAGGAIHWAKCWECEGWHSGYCAIEVGLLYREASVVVDVLFPG